MVTAVYYDHWRERANATIRYRVAFEETDTTRMCIVSGASLQHRMHIGEHMSLLLLRPDAALCSVLHSYLCDARYMDSVPLRVGEVVNGYTMVALDAGVAW